MTTSYRTRRTSQRETGGLPARWQARGVVAALEVLVGAGGTYGGSAMLRDPVHPLGVTADLLEGTPYDDYTWPGILLLTLVGLVGLPPLVLAIALLARVRGAVALSGLYGVGLMAWIVVQWLLIDDRLWLQPAVLGVGALLAATAATAFWRGAR